MMKEKLWKTSQPNGFLKRVRNKYITDQMGKSFKSKKPMPNSWIKRVRNKILYISDLMGRSFK